MAMTNQEIFDKVARHLLTQGKPCKDVDNGICLYRGANGESCAVGCLIPDGVYTTDIEEKSISEILEGEECAQPLAKVLLDIGIESDEQLRLLRDLQELHDNRRASQWRDAMARIADIRGLNATVLDEFPIAT